MVFCNASGLPTRVYHEKQERDVVLNYSNKDYQKRDIQNIIARVEDVIIVMITKMRVFVFFSVEDVRSL